MFLKTLRVCRLYDYAGHRWVDYDGTPLSERLWELPASAALANGTIPQSAVSKAI